MTGLLGRLLDLHQHFHLTENIRRPVCTVHWVGRQLKDLFAQFHAVMGRLQDLPHPAAQILAHVTAVGGPGQLGKQPEQRCRFAVIAQVGPDPAPYGIAVGHFVRQPKRPGFQLGGAGSIVIHIAHADTDFLTVATEGRHRRNG